VRNRVFDRFMDDLRPVEYPAEAQYVSSLGPEHGLPLSELLLTKGRLEAFSDGVLAIVITIMVLEMEAPHEATWAALASVLHVFLAYVLSFVFLGIYWSNHHHLLHITKRVNGRILWANLHLLFWLSLVPFVTRWMGDTKFAAEPVAAYGFVLLASAIAFTILVSSLIAHHGRDSDLAIALGRDFKGKISLAIYTAGILTVYISPIISCALYAVVAIIWLVPDSRIERHLETHPS
jgi:uncharacterized membrane protein